MIRPKRPNGNGTSSTSPPPPTFIFNPTPPSPQNSPLAGNATNTPRTSTSPPFTYNPTPESPRNASPDSNATDTAGSNQIDKAKAGSNNHTQIFPALLTVASLVIVIFVIVSTCYYLKKKKTKNKNKKKKSGDKNNEELPIRYVNESNLMAAQSPAYAMNMIDPPEIKGVSIEVFIRNYENGRPTRFSREQLTTVTRDFNEKLGSGGFGDVYKGELEGGVTVAVKKLKDNKSAQKIQEQFMAELGTIGTTYHVNLVRLQGFCIDPSMTALVYEYMENGSLDRFLFGGNQAIEWRKLHEIAIGTAKGIAYLHEECQPRIIHYDIKPGNILLDAKLIPKVADFGLAKICSIGGSHVTLAGGRGTRGYAAPELWNPLCPVTYKCDVYSFGIVLFEIVGRRRNHDTTVSETRESLSSWTWEMFKKNRLLELVSLCGIEERDRAKAERMSMVALLCIQRLAERRPVMSDVVKMLEGGMEIPNPSYPFEHPESCYPVESPMVTNIVQSQLAHSTYFSINS